MRARMWMLGTLPPGLKAISCQGYHSDRMRSFHCGVRNMCYGIA
jgi:hypothetical protein